MTVKKGRSLKVRMKKLHRLLKRQVNQRGKKQLISHRILHHNPPSPRRG